MNLTEALSTSITVRLVCQACGAHQPAYPQVMMEKHSPDTDLEVAILVWPCMFCDKKGQFVVTICDSS